MADASRRDRVAALLRAFDHETLYALARSSAAQADALVHADRMHPNPDIRTTVALLRSAVTLLDQATSVSAMTR